MLIQLLFLSDLARKCSGVASRYDSLGSKPFCRVLSKRSYRYSPQTASSIGKSQELLAGQSHSQGLSHKNFGRCSMKVWAFFLLAARTQHTKKLGSLFWSHSSPQGIWYSQEILALHSTQIPSRFDEVPDKRGSYPCIIIWDKRTILFYQGRDHTRSQVFLWCAFPFE